VSFLRRLLGGGDPGGGSERLAEPPAGPAEIEDAEREHERLVAREEAERLDELQQRQLRFASYAWKPAAQGGRRRADETDADGTADETDADVSGPH
jgi:hypothetical protein